MVKIGAALEIAEEENKNEISEETNREPQIAIQKVDENENSAEEEKEEGEEEKEEEKEQSGEKVEETGKPEK